MNSLLFIIIIIILLLVEVICQIFWVKIYFKLGIKLFERKFPKRGELFGELFSRAKEDETFIENYKLGYHMTNDYKIILFRRRYNTFVHKNLINIHGYIVEESEYFKIISYLDFFDMAFIALPLFVILLQFINYLASNT
jgi:hypothetical protein